LVLSFLYYTVVLRTQPNTLGRGAPAAHRPPWRPSVPILKHRRCLHTCRRRRRRHRRRRRRLHHRHSSNHPSSLFPCPFLSSLGRQLEGGEIELNFGLERSGPNLKPGTVCVCGIPGLRRGMNTTQHLPSPASRAGADLPTNVQAVLRAVSCVNTHRPRFQARARPS